MSQLRLRPLAFGEVLDGAFTLYRHNFVVFFLSALLAVIPINFVTRSVENLALAADSAENPLLVAGAFLVLMPLSVLLWSLLWAALTQQTAEAYDDGSPSLKAGYGGALRALPALVVAWIIIGLLVMGAAIAVSFVGALLAAPFAAAAGDAGTLIGGAVLMIATATVMLLALSVLFAVVPAVVVERLGPWGAIKRSNQLAKGGRLRVIGIGLVSSLIVLLPTIGLMVMAGMGSAMWDIEAAATLSPVQLFAQQFVAILSSALTTPFMVACFTVLYFDRRIRTEGYDLETAADALATQRAG